MQNSDMEDATIPDNVSSSDNETQLQKYQIWNEELPVFLIHTLPIVYFTFGACLNVTLFIYIRVSGRWKSPIFTVIGSLAIADTMVCMGAVLWANFVYPVITYTDVWWMCHFSMFLGFGGMSTGEYHLVFFAALRFYQLKYPLAARARVTRIFVIRCLALIWVVYITYGGVLWSIVYRPKHVLISEKVELVCEQIGNAHFANIAYLIIDTITPSVSISVLHIAKYFIVARSQKELDVKQNRVNPDGRAISIVIILCVVCWFPLNVYTIIMGSASVDYHMFQDKLYLILIFITCCNSTFNPIIYCIAAKTVRDDFIKFLCYRGNGTRKE